jgi:hypothetical protein
VPKKLTIEELRKKFADVGWELLEHEPRGVEVSYNAKCSCGNVTKKCPKELKKKPGCVMCRNRKLAINARIGIVECRRIFEQNGFILLSTEYKSSKTPMEAVCSCGKTVKISLESVSKGSKCRDCGYKYGNFLRGPDNPSYNPDLTDEERKTDRRMPAFKEWAYKVKERDGFKCVVCGCGKNLVSHHILPYSEYKLVRTSLNNGITMCKRCHTEFHGFYGYKDFDHIDLFTFLTRKWGA